MTKNNEQIIIDGVDVSGCINYEEYYEEDEDVKIENFCAYWHNSCHSCHNYNCNYKLYKRKEQECEELKATLKVIADRPCLNINDCNGNCLPHCKWNAHKLAQEALKGSE